MNQTKYCLVSRKHAHGMKNTCTHARTIFSLQRCWHGMMVYGLVITISGITHYDAMYTKTLAIYQGDANDVEGQRRNYDYLS